MEAGEVQRNTVRLGGGNIFPHSPHVRRSRYQGGNLGGSSVRMVISWICRIEIRIFAVCLTKSPFDANCSFLTDWSCGSWMKHHGYCGQIASRDPSGIHAIARAIRVATSFERHFGGENTGSQ